uniref:Cyclin-G1 n=1 Tax=Equus caballus TaxID=9796 RepID=A0A3Q2IDN6_HORSE
MIGVLTTDSQTAHQLNALLEQESGCQPEVCGLRLIESAHDNGLRMTARLREFEVKDLSLTQFFGFNTETFSLAVNLLDSFLSKMEVPPEHLGCVGLSCFYLAVKSIEEERNVPWCVGKSKLLLPFNFCQLYYSLTQGNLPFERKNGLNFERLEVQLKACYCRIIFSKAKLSVLALSMTPLESQAQKCVDLTEGVECLQKHSKDCYSNKKLFSEASLHNPEPWIPEFYNGLKL